jgi:spore germination cell wall hydrolase CwlJ-like protein
MKKIIAFVLLFAYQLPADEVLTQQERIVALTLLGEARGEQKIGLFAVACVIQHRSLERNLTPMGVCLEPSQFDTWSAGRGKLKKESELYHLWKSKEMMYARTLARHLCRGGLFIDATNGANHFCHINSYPYWIKGKKPCKIIGNHKFFKL